MPDSHPFYYPQSLDFTCGPASLIMALAAMGRQPLPTDMVQELDIWRRANTVLMGRGHAGCGPYGLARVARSFGCVVEILTTRKFGIFEKWNQSVHHHDMVDVLEAHDLAKACEEGCVIADFPSDKEAFWQNLPENQVVIALTGQNCVADGHWMCIISQKNGLLVLDPEQSPPLKAENRVRLLTPAMCAAEFHYLHQYVVILLK